MTAVVVGPKSFPPVEWFARLLRARLDRHRDRRHDGRDHVITTTAKRFNDMDWGLSLPPTRKRRCSRRPKMERLTSTVMDGVFAGMQLSPSKWQPLLHLDRVDHALLLPILLYCTDPLGTLLGPPRRSHITKEVSRSPYYDIPLVTPDLNELGSPRIEESGSVILQSYQ